MPYELTYQLNWLNVNSPTPRLTDAMITDIAAQIALWDAGASTDFTDIAPNVRNFGATIDSDRQRQAIRKNIAVLLEKPDWASGAGGQVTMVRG